MLQLFCHSLLLASEVEQKFLPEALCGSVGIWLDVRGPGRRVGTGTLAVVLSPLTGAALTQREKPKWLVLWAVTEAKANLK